MKAIIDCTKDWLKQCPILSDIEIKTDYLGPDNNKDYYSLEQNQTPNPLTKANVLGTKYNGVANFVLAGRYSFDINNDMDNSNNLKTMQEIAEWIVDNANSSNYPKLNDNEEVTGVDVTSGPFLMGVDKSTTYSRYEIAFQIKYERRYY